MMGLRILFSVVVVLFLSVVVSGFKYKHHNNEEILEVLNEVHKSCPNITRIYTLSETSVLGTPLYIIEFTTAPGQHVVLKPEFKYIANMHGNEVLGRELMLKLADYMCEKYKSGDKEIVNLIKKTRIHLMPSMNPDGWNVAAEKGGTDYLLGRSNANGVDLNRDFPDLDRIMFGNEAYQISHNNHLMSFLRELDHPVQPETMAVMRLIMSTPFVLSANLHGGDLVANYPYDSSRTGSKSEYSETPDDDTFRYISLAYSSAHPSMGDPKRASCEPLDDVNFGKTGGIVNGAKWYSVRGGMQDFNYLSSNDFEITLELGCEKFTKEKNLEQEWNNNRDALLNFIWQSHIGVKGMVRDAITGRPVANAVIHAQNITVGGSDIEEIRDIDHDITSVFGGDYFRLLTPGEYLLTASYAGYKPQTRRIRVNNGRMTEATRLDFWLEPLGYIAEAAKRSNMELMEDIELPVVEEDLRPGPVVPLTSSFYAKPMESTEPEESHEMNMRESDQPNKDWLMNYMIHNIANM